MYEPSHDELIGLGFAPQEWEGVIYGYDLHSLGYQVADIVPGRNLEKSYPFWTLGSWYHPWYPESREQVESVIRGFSCNKGEK